MKVGRSAYYEYRAGRSYQLSEKKKYLADQVKEAFKENRRRYGARRLVPELAEKGIEIGRYQVRALMKMQGLEASGPKRYVPKTTTPDNLKASPNLLRIEGNHPDGPGKVIIGDITYLPMANGRFCYLGSFQDKFTRRIIGWSISERMTEELVTSALRKALGRGFISKGAIIHTDRGSQYSSNNFRGVLKERGLRQSMSGKGNCYDNAQAESFFARYKIELLEGGQFENVSEATSETFSYIEGYYNRKRRHSSLGYLSPANFEKMFRENQQRRN
jgi:putative transposase